MPTSSLFTGNSNPVQLLNGNGSASHVLNNNNAAQFLGSNNVAVQLLGVNNNAVQFLNVNNNTGVASSTPGPEGCNLFVYHLPPDYDESDLVRLFSPHGKIISTKVFRNPATNLSKCFG